MGSEISSPRSSVHEGFWVFPITPKTPCRKINGQEIVEKMVPKKMELPPKIKEIKTSTLTKLNSNLHLELKLHYLSYLFSCEKFQEELHDTK